jgi:hypothetical protein
MKSDGSITPQGYWVLASSRPASYAPAVPSTEFEHTAIAPVTREIAWRQLQKPETWQVLAGVDEVFDVHYAPDGLMTAYRFRATAASQVYEGTATTVEATSPSMMAVEIATSEVTGRITTNLADTGDGVAVSVTVALTSRGFLSTLFFPVVSQALSSGLPKQVDTFATRLRGIQS